MNFLFEVLIEMLVIFWWIRMIDNFSEDKDDHEKYL